MAGGRPSRVGVSSYCPCAWPTLASPQLPPAPILPFPSSLFPTSLSLGPSDCILHSLRPSLDTIPLLVPTSTFVWLLAGSLRSLRPWAVPRPCPQEQPSYFGPVWLGLLEASLQGWAHSPNWFLSARGPL